MPSARPLSVRRTHRGFTLIEILVVVIVVGILTSVVIGAFTGSDRRLTLQGYAERLALRIEMARDKALQRNKEWGMYVEDEGVRFAEFDEVNGEWVERTTRPFVDEGFAENLEFRVRVEEFDVASEDLFAADNRDDKRKMPSVIIYSSGEVTPFDLTVTPREWQGAGWTLSSDGFTRTVATAQETI